MAFIGSKEPRSPGGRSKLRGLSDFNPSSINQPHNAASGGDYDETLAAVGAGTWAILSSTTLPSRISMMRWA
jgi:hypothetical protein